MSSEQPDTPAEAAFPKIPTRLDVAIYLRDMLNEFTQIATREQFERLHYALGIAQGEADRVCRALTNKD